MIRLQCGIVGLEMGDGLQLYECDCQYMYMDMTVYCVHQMIKSIKHVVAKMLMQVILQATL